MIPISLYTNEEAREAFYQNNKDKIRMFDFVRAIREEQDEE